MKILETCPVNSTSRFLTIGTILLVMGLLHTKCCAFPQEAGNQQPGKSDADAVEINSDSNDDAGKHLTDEEPDPEAYDDRNTQRSYEKLFKKLKRMKPPREAHESSGEQGEESQTSSLNNAKGSLGGTANEIIQNSDSFVIGTAAVNPKTQNADVCFRAVNGIDETARAIIQSHSDTIARGEISHWYVFYRVASEDEAQPLLVELQRKYDEQLAYRQQLMQQYNARTIRRC